MLMRIPKQIKVAGHKYSVKHVSSIKNGKVRARVNHEMNRITLSRRGSTGPYAESLRAEDFLHEIIHCVSVAYVHATVAEATIGQLGVGLFQVIRDNNLDFRQPKKGK